MPHTTKPAPLTLDPRFFTDPYAVYAALREEGPVRRVMLPNGWDVWVVTRYAEARAALADPRLRKDPRVLTEQFNDVDRDDELVAASLRAHMLNADPPDHTRLRKLVTKAFTARRIEGLRPRIEAITDQLLDDLATRVGDGPVDLIDTFAFPLPITVIGELLGVPPHDRDDFRAWSTTIVSDGTDEEVQVASYAMARYLDQLLADKRADPADDLLTALIQARDDEDRLDEHELVSMAFLLLVAGHETTVNLIGNGMLALLRHPDQLDLLRRDPSLVPGAIEELLRYDGPVNLATMRFTAEPVVVGGGDGSRDGEDAAGVEIPAGEFVLVSLASADHDRSRFADPDRLDVTRPAGGHLAFGHGIHYCLGAPLARLEGEIAFTRLLARFPRLQLAGAPAELRWRNSSLIRGLERLPIHLG